MTKITQTQNMAGTHFYVGQRVEYHSGENGWLPGTVREIDEGPRRTVLMVEIDQPEFLGPRDRPYELNERAAAEVGYTIFNPLLHHGKTMGNFRPLGAPE